MSPPLWDALDEMCDREKLSVHDLCSRIDRKRFGPGLTAALRAYIVEYYRVASTEHGHESAGHGALPPEYGQDENDVVPALVRGAENSCTNAAKP